MTMRTPLSRARGLGSAREGVHHWWGQRITAVALVPLSLWFVYSLLRLSGTDHLGMQAWLGFHGNLTLLTLFVVALFYHAVSGLQVVIEDYVHGEAWKVAALTLVRFGGITLAVSCIVAAVRVSFGG